MEPTNNNGQQGDTNQVPQVPGGAPSPLNEVPASPDANRGEPQPQADGGPLGQAAPVAPPPTTTPVAPTATDSNPMPTSQTPVDPGLGGPAAPGGGPSVPEIKPNDPSVPAEGGENGGQHTA